MILSGARVVTPGGVIDDGWVEVEADRISAVGSGEAADGAFDLGGRWLVPGFVDIHVHGGGGGSFELGDEEEARIAAEFHLRHGTTTLVASLVTAPLERLAGGVECLSPLVRAGVLAGVHLEGPFISRARCGAHDPAHVLVADPAALARLLGSGPIRMVTLAPEGPGALDAIRVIAEGGAVAAVGHTDATYEQARAAWDAGATVATHLFNAMRPVHHREPGAALAALEDERVVVELIADGVHLHDAVVRDAFTRAGADRIALVTDAIATAGVGDGDYDLGTRRVCVRDGVARVAGGSALAGSLLTMDAALRRVVRDCGVPLPEAVRAASTTPARALGLGDRVGAIAPGLRADLVALDETLAVSAVMRGGAWVNRG